MSQLMVPPSLTELANVDEVVSISMVDQLVVIRSTRKPDALGTQVLVDVVNAANVAGSTVALHRRGVNVDANAAIVEQPTNAGIAMEPVMAHAAGVGLLEVCSTGPIWTIDFGSARFVCTDRPIHRLFLSASEWTTYDAIWIGPQSVRVLTVDGRYLTGRRALQPRQVCDSHRPRQRLRHIA